MAREKPTTLSGQLGAKIAKLRKVKGMTQGQLEKAAGFHQGYISRVENGLILPDLESIKSVAEALELTLAKLVSGL